MRDGPFVTRGMRDERKFECRNAGLQVVGGRRKVGYFHSENNCFVFARKTDVGRSN